ncbi:hypothetical protein IscW_ISCW019687 [Ixodes scapularis]|uniref:Uncharacterized protein n=1 Tax=Ixodes scapularis TaxID=6945 RepID=B7PVZ7_IXOSC|nr:hypothetical protein IscW_ISCW019687 [Ixodes scapularis]|eukprot:XP_002408897.1 hypothetical protein IscW_ISCW019687 [Ixodes scapularis]
MSTLMEDIQAWLSAKGAAWSPDMIKGELLKIVAMTKHCGEKYRIDTIAAAAGHGYVAFLNKEFKMVQLGPLVDEAINQWTAEKLANFVRHVVDEEAALRKADHIMVDVFD